MFTKTIMSIATAVAVASSALAAPTSFQPRHLSSSPISFNNWGGFSSLSNFDDFYGVDNFSGFSNQVVEVQEQDIVCHDQSIDIVQQQLAVLREFAKSVITQSICEVEVQTIVYGQFISGLSDFSDDLLHQSGRSIGFDQNIANMIGSLHDSNGNLNFNDLGFHGSDIGSHFITPTGSNWDDSSSPVSVGSAFGLTVAAGSI